MADTQLADALYDHRDVRFEIRGPVALITLDRPERRNALDGAVVDALAAAFDAAEADPAVRAVVVAGAGDAFCSGAVLDTLIASADGRFDDVVAVYEGFLRVLRSPLPTIAAVNGPAVGAGLNLALACDVRLAAPSAKFESRFPALRLHPGGGHTWMLERAVGRQRATMMALFGEVLDGAQALDAGLVAAVVEAPGLIDAAIELGARLGGMEREFVTTVVATLRTAEQTVEHTTVLELETERQRWSTTRADFVEHTTALRDRIAGGRR